MSTITLPSGVTYGGARLEDFQLHVVYRAAKGKAKKTLSLPDGVELRTTDGIRIKNLRFFAANCTPAERFERDFEGLVKISGSVYKPDAGVSPLVLRSVSVVD